MNKHDLIVKLFLYVCIETCSLFDHCLCQNSQVNQLTVLLLLWVENTCDLDCAIRWKISQFEIGFSVLKVLQFHFSFVENLGKLNFLLANPIFIKSAHMKGSSSLVTVIDIRINGHYLKDFIFIGSNFGFEFNIFTQSYETILLIFL